MSEKHTKTRKREIVQTVITYDLKTKVLQAALKDKISVSKWLRKIIKNEIY